MTNGLGKVGRVPGGESAALQRIEVATGLTAGAAHAVAGLMDAEGSFAIHPNNGGSTWACSARIALREDDAEILVGVQEALGLGQLAAVAPRAGSRAQIQWCVASKLECLVLAEIFAEFPLRGRKRLEFDLWTRAVRLWARDRYTADPRVWRKLADLASQIRLARRYREPCAAAVEPCGDRALVDFFGGFFSGDGCPLLPKEGGARLVVKLRRDDRPLLETFAASFAMGKIRNVKAWSTSSPTAVWTVTSRPDLLRAVALLDSTALLGRKQEQYLAWRVGALEVVRAWLEGRKANPVVLDMARCALSAARAFTPATGLPAVGDRRAAGRSAYVRVLREWAAGCEGRLTCMRYMDDRAQHPGWPNRDTIARVFGSWSAALRAAGLDG